MGSQISRPFECVTGGGIEMKWYLRDESLCIVGGCSVALTAMFVTAASMAVREEDYLSCWCIAYGINVCYGSVSPTKKNCLLTPQWIEDRHCPACVCVMACLIEDRRCLPASAWWPGLWFRLRCIRVEHCFRFSFLFVKTIEVILSMNVLTRYSCQQLHEKLLQTLMSQ